MKSFATMIIASSLVASCATAAQPEESTAPTFEEQFKAFSKAAIMLEHHPAVDGPWGTPNPDAAAELEQFAFMVGRHECTQPLKGVIPNDPEKVMQGDLLWLAYYALDGRAIRDEFYSMGGIGEQTRAYDPYAKEWWVTYATVPGVFSFAPEPKPGRGSFSAVQNDQGHMVMTTNVKDNDGVDYVNTITFYDISDAGFEWKSENVYPDKSVSTGTLSCRKVAGPGL